MDHFRVIMEKIVGNVTFFPVRVSGDWIGMDFFRVSLGGGCLTLVQKSTFLNITSPNAGFFTSSTEVSAVPDLGKK